jgi:hypothetical protein
MNKDETPSVAAWVALIAVVVVIWVWISRGGQIRELEEDIAYERQRTAKVEQDFADLESAICELPFRNDLMRDIETWINISGPYDPPSYPVVFTCPGTP